MEALKSKRIGLKCSKVLSAAMTVSADNLLASICLAIPQSFCFKLN